MLDAHPAAALEDLMTAVPDLGTGHVWADRRPSALAMVTHVPLATLNGVWAFDGAHGDDVADLLRELPAQGLQYCVQASPGTTGVEQAAAAAGLTAAGSVPLMLLDSEPSERTVPDLTIRELSAQEFDLRTDVVSAAFEVLPEVMRNATALFSRVPGYRMYLGEVDGQPVTSAVGITRGDAVGIFDVATPAQHRGRGYGAAITIHAVRAGMRLGARWSWLQSSPEGLPVYEKIGFRTVEQWPLWLSDGV